ncbi:hypothetical protein Tco_1338172 [Tanacetum coccineum]
MVEESSKKAEAEIAQEESSKRAGTELEKEESAKKKKIDDAQETTKMKEHIKIVPDEEEVAIDAIPLATKPLSIVDWKIHKEGQTSYYQITRADGNSKIRYSMEESTRKQSVDLEAFLFLWSTLCEVSKSAHLYASGEKVSSDTCYNHRHAEQEATS